MTTKSDSLAAMKGVAGDEQKPAADGNWSFPLEQVYVHFEQIGRPYRGWQFYLSLACKHSDPLSISASLTTNIGLCKQAIAIVLATLAKCDWFDY
jgi:hypothetical protein